MMNVQRGASVDEIELLKSNNENKVKMELNKFFNFKSDAQKNHKDTFIRFSGEVVTPLSEL
jgi:hypothetical protein